MVKVTNEKLSEHLEAAAKTPNGYVCGALVATSLIKKGYATRVEGAGRGRTKVALTAAGVSAAG